MLTQAQISAYVEEMRHAEEDPVGEDSRLWEWLRQRRLIRGRENRLPVAEWYREYEEKTGTMLGCD